MYEAAFQRVIFPLLDRANGTHISRTLNLLREMEQYSLDELRAIQTQKLGELLEWTERNSTLYSDHWRSGNGTGPSSDYPSLDGLPLVDKPILGSIPGHFPLPEYRGKTFRIQTSGSTGKPTIFFRSVEQESWFWALRLRMWEWAGVRLGAPYMAINLNRRLAWKKRLQDKFFRCTYLSYNTDTQDSARIVRHLESGKIHHINAFSSTLLALARHMQENQIPNPGVEVITATGDNLVPTHRELIESTFGIGVNDYFGAGGEGMHLGSQCRERGGYHLHLENSIIEVITEGRPARAGEVGELVVTQLDNRAMPLVRYRLGDLVTTCETDEGCACGRAHPMVKEINGRATDMIKAPNGATLLPQFFFIGAFKMLENVSRYQVVQEQLERATIKLVAEPGCDRKRCEASLLEEMNRATSGSLAIDFAWVDEIPLSGIGKPRAVVSTLDHSVAPSSSAQEAS